jgi:hypothetical protein
VSYGERRACMERDEGTKCPAWHPCDPVYLTTQRLSMSERIRVGRVVEITGMSKRQVQA